MTVLLAGLWSGVADAFSLDMALGSWRGPGFEVERARLILDEPGSALAGRVEAARLSLPEPIGELEAVRLDCPVLEIKGGTVACPDGRLRLAHDWIEARDAALALIFDTRGAVTLALEDLRLGDGRLNLAFNGQREDWSLQLEVAGLTPAHPLLAENLPAGRWSGAADFQVALSGDERGPMHGQWRFEGWGLAYSAPSGLLAGEELHLVSTGTFSAAEAGGHAFEAALDWQAGAAYLDPVFVEVDVRPLRLELAGEFDPADRLSLSRFRFDDPGHLVLAGSLSADRRDSEGEGGPGWSLTHLEVADLDADLAAIWPRYLQPYLWGSGFEDLALLGRLSGQMALDEAGLSALDLRLAESFVDDPAGRLAFYNLDGRLRWERERMPGESHLAMEGGRLLGLDLGPASLRLEAGGDRLRLPERFRLPLLDGALRFNYLSLEGLGGESPAADLSVTVEPISMRRLSTALGWPPFEGILAGDIPRLSFGEAGFSVDGQLVVHAFDGNVLLDALTLSDPFGSYPVLRGDLRFRGIDLKPLTQAFGFGRIEGRLDGHVHDLVLVGWQPTRFDAAFYTPADDRSRRRISQRAVDNLTSLGGGVGGALGAGFLRFFEDFRYGQLGLSCRLDGAVCLMDGVGPAPSGGYYIVEGAGLPRIDVIGYTREVAWQDLINRLKAVQQGGPPTFEMP